MTLKQYLILMTFLTAFCWAGWVAVVRAVDPLGSGALGFVLFYASLILALSGTFAIAGLTVRSLLRRHEPPSRHVPVSFRQGVLLAVMLGAGLLLESHGLLTWWNLVLLFAVVLVVEFLLISLRSKPH